MSPELPASSVAYRKATPKAMAGEMIGSYAYEINAANAIIHVTSRISVRAASGSSAR
jgi:hypothetical protein